MITPFKLEEYLTQYEFSSPYLFCCSDAQSMKISELLALAHDDEKNAWDHLALNYTEPLGLPLLREMIASELYPPLQSNQILCFAGAEEGIYCALSALCQPKDHVIVLTPCYQSLKEIPIMRGAAVTEIALKEENQWRIDLEKIRLAIQPNTKCLVMNFPHNPTGQVITQEELTALIALLEPQGIWLFSDEVYRLLGNPSKPWASPAAELYDRALSLGVMSKSLGMPGLRVGWIACQNTTILHEMKCIKDYLSICNSAPSEILSLIALRNKDQILARNNHIVRHNLSLLDDFFKRFPDHFNWVKPEGGCVGFVNYLANESVDVFCQRIIQKHGILLMPASIYDCETNHFRVGYGRSNMPEILALFEAVFQ